MRPCFKRRRYTIFFSFFFFFNDTATTEIYTLSLHDALPISGFVTPPTQGAYSASKHAIEAVANALRYELYPYGIETILIEPGYIVTNIQQTALELAKSYQEEFQSGPYAKIYATYWSNATSTRAQSKTTPEDCARI